MKKYLPICIIVLLSVVSLSIYGKEHKKEETNTIKENDNRFTIAAYINGVYSDTMPTESKYFGYVECKDNSGNKLDTLGFVEWENNKWNVRITDITKASTCNVYFIDPPAHWLDAGEGTLLKAIKDNNKVENVKTIPGKQINKADEALLSGTYDDYGTSYYFRGNVQNNYVVFANKCWRIVRITGNGSIKLLLWNNSGIACTSNTVPSSAFNSASITYSKTNGETGNLYQTASGVGFMYGKPDAGIAFSNNNTGAQDNINDSTILTNLKLWYDTTFDTANTTDYTNLLADVIWCGDKSVASGSGVGQLNDKSSVFKPQRRIYPIKDAAPSLICPSSGLDGKTSKYTANDAIYGNGKLKSLIRDDPLEYNYYKIGLITIDEAAFAGGAYLITNTNYYLYAGLYYWTMSPANFANSNAEVWRVFSNGRLYASSIYNNVSTSNQLRPSVALNYNVQVTYDTESANAPGTVNNPYIIS